MVDDHVVGQAASLGVHVGLAVVRADDGAVKGREDRDANRLFAKARDVRVVSTVPNIRMLGALEIERRGAVAEIHEIVDVEVLPQRAAVRVERIRLRARGGSWPGSRKASKGFRVRWRRVRLRDRPAAHAAARLALPC